MTDQPYHLAPRPRRLRHLALLILVCSLVLPSIAGGSQSGTAPYVLIEDFTSAAEFTQTSSNVRIGDGLVYWDISRSGGQQFVYRPIPAFTGDLALLVRGQINSATNNCRVQIGVGDSPGTGVAVNFGYLGGGCGQNGMVVTGSGVALNAREDPACNYVGDWLWIQPGIPYSASLTTSGDLAQLIVSGVGSSAGSTAYSGVYDTLYVGLNGDGDWPSCSGTIDSVVLVAGNASDLANMSIDPIQAEAITRDMLRGDTTEIIASIEAYLDPAHRPQMQFYLPLALGYWMGGPFFADGLRAALADLPDCLLRLSARPANREAASFCVDEWQRATDSAYADADQAIQRWYDVATLEGVQQVAEGVVEEVTLRLGAAAAGTAIPGSILFSAFGAITGTIHLVRLQDLAVDALAQIARVWYTDLGFTAAQDFYSSIPAESRTARVPSTSAQAVTANSQWAPVVEVIGGVDMVLVPPGCFDMGWPISEEDERPVHEVCFEQPFWIDRYEVTNEQFTALGGRALSPSAWIAPRMPRANVTWFEANGFCAMRGMRLPTEAEWEYANRGPDGNEFAWDGPFDRTQINNLGVFGDRPESVGSRPRGVSWVGAHDFYGNVAEIVADWYAEDYYTYSPRINPQGPESGNIRVFRGGSHLSGGPLVSAMTRSAMDPSKSNASIGFRCAYSENASPGVGATSTSEPSTVLPPAPSGAGTMIGVPVYRASVCAGSLDFCAEDAPVPYSCEELQSAIDDSGVDTLGSLYIGLTPMNPDDYSLIRVASQALLPEGLVFANDAAWQMCPNLILLPAEVVPATNVSSVRPSSWGELSQYRNLWSDLAFRDRTTPGREFYETTVDAGQTYALSFTWCASRAEDLAGIVAPLSVVFGINGYMLPTSAYFAEDRGNCRRYGLLLDGWVSGMTTDVQVYYALSRNIFDGVSTYEAGEYVHQITVYVR